MLDSTYALITWVIGPVLLTHSGLYFSSNIGRSDVTSKPCVKHFSIDNGGYSRTTQTRTSRA